MKQTNNRQERLSIKGLLLMLIVFFPGLSLYAQVTVGSGLAPEKGALLDMKTQVPDVSNQTTTFGGLVLPRVKLVDINTLEPFIENTDSDLEELKTSHTGLIVYNLSLSAPFRQGLYVWDGKNGWISTRPPRQQ